MTNDEWRAARLRFPASVYSAGENLAVGLDRQADLAAVDAAAGVMQEAVEQVQDDGRGEARRIGVDEEKQRPVAQDLLTLVEEAPEVVLQFPHLAGGPAAVGRRVHDDRVVLAAALELTAHELEAVVGDVADRRGGEAGEGGVLAAPLHHALGGVDVAHARPRGGGCDRGGPGVAE